MMRQLDFSYFHRSKLAQRITVGHAIAPIIRIINNNSRCNHHRFFCALTHTESKSCPLEEALLSITAVDIYKYRKSHHPCPRKFTWKATIPVPAVWSQRMCIYPMTTCTFDFSTCCCSACDNKHKKLTAYFLKPLSAVNHEYIIRHRRLAIFKPLSVPKQATPPSLSHATDTLAARVPDRRRILKH